MSLSALVITLLDFERSPGRWPQGRREPALLYQQTTPVLMLAAGRPVEGLQQLDDAGQARARRAARFFVRTALLRPGADPYTVLGLARTADSEAVRTHYRLMIRLTHPDFSGAGSEWPADAATRINLANDVLSSPVRRAALDSALDQAEAEAARAARERFKVAAAVAPVVPPRTSAAAPTAPARASGAPSGALKMAGLALGALAALAGFFMINPSGEDASLVARGSGHDALPGAATRVATKLDDAPAKYRLVTTDEAPSPAPEAAEAASLNLKLATATQRQAPEPAPVTAEPPSPPPEKAPKPPATVRQQAPAPDRMVSPRTVDAPRTSPPPVALLPALPPPPATAAAVVGTASAAVAPLPAPPPAPAMAAASAAPEPVVTAPVAVAAPPPVARAPRLTDVQPLLARVEQQAQRGLGMPLAMLIHPSTRNTPVTQKFIFDFQDALAGYRVAGLNRSDLNAREAGDQLDVDLRMQFNLEDPQGGYLSRPVSVRARFGRVDDKVALVRLTVIKPGSGS